jgi:hypothetical protein
MVLFTNTFLEKGHVLKRELRIYTSKKPIIVPNMPATIGSVYP